MSHSCNVRRGRGVASSGHTRVLLFQRAPYGAGSASRPDGVFGAVRDAAEGAGYGG
jgi:hypothetical protein